MSKQLPNQSERIPIPLHGPREIWKVAPLPKPLTTFVGREQESEIIRNLVSDPEVRIVTLTGTGGVGKTRLAIKVASEIAPSFSAAAFVPLTSATDPDQVLPAIAHAFGVQDTGSQPLVERIADHLDDSNVLLVLDNMEHLVDSAAALSYLLAACPGVTILATSRMVLRISGEHNIVIAPFAVPPVVTSTSLTEPSAVPAIQLFVDRARAANPTFALTEENLASVRDVCLRLDGVALAIELAAAQSRLLSPSALLAHMAPRLDILVDGPRDQPHRLQSMREAIAWSYALLNPEQQRVFRACSVFVGGFNLEAALAVLESDMERSAGINGQALHLLGPLVDMNLLLDEQQPDGEPRFSMLETIREFASEELAKATDEVQIRDRHSAYYLTYAEQAESRLVIIGSAEWVRQLGLERANLRAAVEWSLARGDAASILRLAGTTLSLAYARGAPAEALGWLEVALDIGQDAPPDLRVDALYTVSALAQVQGDFDRAIQSSLAGLEIARSSGNTFGEARALFNLGITREWQGDLVTAGELYLEADARMKDVPSSARLAHWTLLPMANLADLALLSGDTAKAIALAEEVVSHWRSDGYLWGVAQALGTIAAAACARGDVNRSARLYSEVLASWLACDDGRGVAGTIAGIAALAAARGQLDRAAELLGAAWAYGDYLGIQFLAHHRYAEQTRTDVKSKLGESDFGEAWSTGASWSRDEALSKARAVLASAEASVARDQILSPRELDVLRLLVAGHPDREIAELLAISPRTVQTHVAGLFSKLHAGSRAEAAAIAVRRGLA